MSEEDTKNEVVSKFSDCMQSSLLKTLVEEESLVCPNCHNQLDWINDSIRCPICKDIFKYKNGVIDFYNKYQSNNLDNLVMPNEF
ncbi:MAG: hypothetical protein QG575_146, partial [Euryarchaeota archaeon]|nr:hypothetical protein [Euryarchaeota archaeon]